MSTPPKSLSPAELAKLEHAFASDPSSDAYRPLAEAYLGMGRFMEAMVVCKKGVKAHPTLPDARVLLARVYADQGKDKKAIEELQAALLVAPEDRAILRQLGGLQMKTQDVAGGRANLLKAFEAAPADPETQAVFAPWKVDLPRPAPPPEPVAAPPPPPAPAQARQGQLRDDAGLLHRPGGLRAGRHRLLRLGPVDGAPDQHFQSQPQG